MKVAMLVFFSIMAILWGTVRFVNYVTFTQGCGGHLKRAADSNTVELATQELGVAVKYAEANNLTQGYTSIIYRTPDEDITFWYKNLSASLAELRAVKPDATLLEKSNVLLKLRETLLDHTKDGEKITVPQGISVYPTNTFYGVWGLVSIVGVCIFGFFVFNDF